MKSGWERATARAKQGGCRALFDRASQGKIDLLHLIIAYHLLFPHLSGNLRGFLEINFYR